MIRAPFLTCSHKACGGKPCTRYEGMQYLEDNVWGWGTACDYCDDHFYPYELPEEHAEERHEELL